MCIGIKPKPLCHSKKNISYNKQHIYSNLPYWLLLWVHICIFDSGISAAQHWQYLSFCIIYECILCLRMLCSYKVCLQDVFRVPIHFYRILRKMYAVEFSIGQMHTISPAILRRQFVFMISLVPRCR